MALAIADQIRFRFRFRMRMDLAAHFLPLLAGAAIRAIGGYFLSKNLAPKDAYVPPTDWPRNRPAVSGPLNPVIGSAINTGKATGNSPSPTSGFADLNKAKTW